jgi:hypothetical protein
LAILSRRSFLDAQRALALVSTKLTPHRAQLIAERDPSFALEILVAHQDVVSEMVARVRYDLCLGSYPKRDGWVSLAALVSSRPDLLRNELELLKFVLEVLEAMSSEEPVEVITPMEVLIRLDNDSVDEIAFASNKQLSPDGSLYRPPTWCLPRNRWRLQIGYLLRFILSAKPDFTRSIRRAHWKEGLVVYRAPESHWFQRIYGLHSGHSAFGADWLPVTDWTEHLLYVLLAWPGCRTSEVFAWIELGIETTRRRVAERIDELSQLRGPLSNTLMLPLSAPWPERPTKSRPLRVCVVQTVIPGPSDFDPADLTMSEAIPRRRHRNHLSAALGAVERMLDLRETHKDRASRLDWLILPELAVHPRDVETHLVPFVRAHKTIVLAGLTYEEVVPGRPLINSALWLIPIWSPERGLEVLRRRQGKHHLAPEEDRLNEPVERLRGFRPCQWLIAYEWNSIGGGRPLWLTGSICYDATDIRLAADLRDRSDIFAVPALNRDVNTFDQMALALHYHMFQMVVVANNGTFGGSNAYAPYYLAHERQVFHLHGQPQASIAFLEIDDISAFLRRGEQNSHVPLPGAGVRWKHVPAGFTPQHSA